MDFGGLLHADDPELEVMHCREGSVFSYTRGIGDPGTRWTHAQAAAAFGQIESWHPGHPPEELGRLRSGQTHQCPQAGDMLQGHGGVRRWR